MWMLIEDLCLEYLGSRPTPDLRDIWIHKKQTEHPRNNKNSLLIIAFFLFCCFSLQVHRYSAVLGRHMKVLVSSPYSVNCPIKTQGKWSFSILANLEVLSWSHQEPLIGVRNLEFISSNCIFLFNTLQLWYSRHIIFY